MSGKQRRNQGIARVASVNHDWMEHGLQLIEKHVPIGAEFIAELFRSLPNIGEPTHPNAWGALTNSAIHRGLISYTHQTTSARRPASHARRYPIWRRVPPP